jgi:hypothetical protein
LSGTNTLAHNYGQKKFYNIGPSFLPGKDLFDGRSGQADISEGDLNFRRFDVKVVDFGDVFDGVAYDDQGRRKVPTRPENSAPAEKSFQMVVAMLGPDS